MKIHGHPLSWCTRKVLILIAEKDAPLQGNGVELVTVDLFEHAQKKPEHLARHPFGVVPVLDDDGFVLYESRAILRYLDEHLPGPSFRPRDLRARAAMDQWLSVDQSYIAPHTRTLAVERILRTREGLEPDAKAIDHAERSLAAAFEVFDRVLVDRAFLCGEISLADISLVPYLASLPMIGAEHLLADRPRLHAWRDRMRARPSARVLG